MYHNNVSVCSYRERERKNACGLLSLGLAWLGGAWGMGGGCVGGLCVAVSDMACSAAVSCMCAWPVVPPPSQTEHAH